MERHEVAVMLGRERTCKSVDRAMAIVAQGYDLVAVMEGGADEDWERAKREHPDAHLVVLARGRSLIGDRIGIFYPQGYVEPRLF